MSTTVVMPAEQTSPMSTKKKNSGSSLLSLLLLLLHIIVAVCCIAFNGLALSYRHLPVSALFSETVAPGDKFDHFLFGRRVSRWSGTLELLEHVSCAEIDEKILSNDMWKTCEGVWEPHPHSLEKNVKAANLEGFIKPNLPKTKRCGQNYWDSSTLDPTILQTEKGLSNPEDYALRMIANDFSDLSNPLNSQKNKMRCNSSTKSYHDALAVICISTVVMSCLASIVAILAPRSCCRKSPILFVLSSFVFALAICYSHLNWGVMKKFSVDGYTQCKDFSPEEYYSKLPPETCMVTSTYTDCVERDGYTRVSGLSATSEEQWKEKDITLREIACLDELKGNNEVFVTKEDLSNKFEDGECSSQTTVCASSELTFDPMNSGEAKYCYQCTHGPRWDLNAQAATQIAAIPSDGSDTTTTWNDGYQNLHTGSSCMWVEEAYAGHSPSMRSKATGKTCVNRKREIESSECLKDSLAKFLFEFGSPLVCSETNKGNVLKYPECTYENYEMCYVKRAEVMDNGLYAGENTCVISSTEVTECVCDESTKESGSLKFDLCKGVATCNNNEEKEQCEFLEPSSSSGPSHGTPNLYNSNAFIHRFIAENEICQQRDNSECSYGWWDLYCRSNQAGQCMPLYVECNAEQEKHFQKKKSYFEFESVPDECITDNDGNYQSVIAGLIRRHGNMAMLSCISLFTVAAMALALAASIYGKE